MHDRFYILLIVAISVAVTFTNIQTLPFWHWDEGVNMNIAWNLINGRFLKFAVTYPYVPHPPFNFLLYGIMMKLFGQSILVLRSFSAFIAILTSVLLYYVGRNLGGQKIGFIAGLAYAITPHILYWNRMAFSTNFLALLIVAIIYLIQRDRYTIACAVAGIAIVSDPIGPIIAALTLILLYHRKRLSRVRITVIFIPFTFYLVIMLYVFRQEYITDLTYALSRFGVSYGKLLLLAFFIVIGWSFREKLKVISTRIVKVVIEVVHRDFEFTFGEQLGCLKNMFPYIFLFFLNIYWSWEILQPVDDDVFLNGFGYFWFGVFGLLMLKVKWILYFLFIPLFVFLMAIDRTDHMLIPLHPFLVLGLAVVLSKLHDFMVSRVRGRNLAVVCITFLIFYPFLLFAIQDYVIFVKGEGLYKMPVDEVVAVTDFINNNSQSDDVIIATSYFTPYLKARHSTLIQSIAYEGKSITYYRGDINSNRWVYNTSYLKAKFVVTRGNISEWLRNNSRGDVADYLDNKQVVYNTTIFLVYT